MRLRYKFIYCAVLAELTIDKIAFVSPRPYLFRTDSELLPAQEAYFISCLFPLREDGDENQVECHQGVNRSHM